jgi:inorganic triphosphatase YgiF
LIGGDENPPAAEPVEVEVKLGVARPAAVRALLLRPDADRLAGFAAAGEPHVVTLTDRYLDTDRWDGRLYVAGIRARLRRQGRATTLTVKRASALDRGVATRVELHGQATSTIEPRRWPPSAARSLLLETLDGEPLKEIARLRQRRLTRMFGRDATTVEVSLDALEALDGRLVVGRRHELEAELVAGDEVALAELGEALLAIEGVGQPLGSKLRFALEATLVR